MTVTDGFKNQETVGTAAEVKSYEESTEVKVPIPRKETGGSHQGGNRRVIGPLLSEE